MEKWKLLEKKLLVDQKAVKRNVSVQNLTESKLISQWKPFRVNNESLISTKQICLLYWKHIISKERKAVP